jgi:hypothetical protein
VPLLESRAPNTASTNTPCSTHLILFDSLTLPLLYNPKDVLGVHYPVLLVVELDLRTRILANHHIPYALLHVSWAPAATTSAVCGFSLAVSGSTILDAVVSLLALDLFGQRACS